MQTHPAAATPTRRHLPTFLGHIAAGTAPTTSRLVTIDLSAFDDTAPSSRGRDASNADFWEAVARREISSLRAAKILARQLHHSVGVPTSLGQALAAMEVGIARNIELAILTHDETGGTKAEELKLAWKAVL